MNDDVVRDNDADLYNSIYLVLLLAHAVRNGVSAVNTAELKQIRTATEWVMEDMK